MKLCCWWGWREYMFVKKKCSWIKNVHEWEMLNMWPCATWHALVLPFVVFYGVLWPFYGLLWHNIDLTRLLSSFFVVIWSYLDLNKIWGLRSLIDTVSNKKIHLTDFETCVFLVYLRNHLSYKEVIFFYSHSCLKSFQIIMFQMQKEFFKSCHKISWYLQKRCFARNK